jgi:hypothetical protein
MHQVFAIRTVIEKLCVAGAVLSVVAKRLPAGERFGSACTDHVAAALLNALDLPRAGLPGSVKQHGVRGFKGVPGRVDLDGRARNRSWRNVDAGQD